MRLHEGKEVCKIFLNRLARMIGIDEHHIDADWLVAQALREVRRRRGDETYFGRSGHMVPRFWICVHADQLLGERDHAIEQPAFENSQFQIDARPEDAGEVGGNRGERTILHARKSYWLTFPCHLLTRRAAGFDFWSSRLR